MNNLDLALFKNFSFTARRPAAVPAGVVQRASTTRSSTDVSTNIASANFGVVTSARPARINQFGLKLLF